MHNPHSGFVFSSKEHLWHEKTNFQTIDIINNEFLGRIFLIDGTVMFTDKDEFIYHEMISHVPAFAHPSPQKALVLGGEMRRFERASKTLTIREATLVEIDQKVLDLSCKFFPKIASKI